MEEPGDLLEDSWFFGNLLHTKTKNTISRCYSDLTSSSCPHPTHPLPPLCSNQESIVKNEGKSSSFSSRKQPPIAPRSLNRTPSLPNSMETQSFFKKDMNPSPHLTRISSMASSEDESDQENEEEEDQESEFRLGRLIRQASMNSLHTSNPSPKTSKVMMENMGKKSELGQEKMIFSDVRKMERNRSKNNIKISGKKKNGGGAPAIPRGLVDKSSSEDMKAHIKFWARAVATNVRQECS